MNIIKLDKRHILYHHGYRVAIKFDSFKQAINKIFEIHAVSDYKTLGHHTKKNINVSKIDGYDGEYLLGFKSKEQLDEVMSKINAWQ